MKDKKIIYKGRTVYISLNKKKVFAGGDYTDITANFTQTELAALIKKASKK